MFPKIMANMVSPVKRTTTDHAHSFGDLTQRKQVRAAPPPGTALASADGSGPGEKRDGPPAILWLASRGGPHRAFGCSSHSGMKSA
jgi:hypothetical protein